jgi:hypothetical protein
MGRRHSTGEPFIPSASEMNGWGDAADYYRKLKSHQGAGKQNVWQTGASIIWVKNTGEVEIPKFGCAILDEPVNKPEDDITNNEFINFVAFKAKSPLGDVAGGESWWQYFTKYKHPVILQETAPIDSDELFPAVVDGVSFAKITFVGPVGLNDPNAYPTAAIPVPGGSLETRNGGPIKIIWIADDDDDDGKRLSLVKVSSDYRYLNFIQGAVDDDVAKGGRELLNLDFPFHDGSEQLYVRFPFFSALKDDRIGAEWDENLQDYIAIAKECPDEDED